MVSTTTTTAGRGVMHHLLKGEESKHQSGGVQSSNLEAGHWSPPNLKSTASAWRELKPKPDHSGTKLKGWCAAFGNIYRVLRRHCLFPTRFAIPQGNIPLRKRGLTATTDTRYSRADD